MPLTENNINRNCYCGGIFISEIVQRSGFVFYCVQLFPEKIETAVETALPAAFFLYVSFIESQRVSILVFSRAICIYCFHVVSNSFMQNVKTLHSKFFLILA